MEQDYLLYILEEVKTCPEEHLRSRWANYTRASRYDIEYLGANLEELLQVLTQEFARRGLEVPSEPERSVGHGHS